VFFIACSYLFLCVGRKGTFFRRRGWSGTSSSTGPSPASRCRSVCSPRPGGWKMSVSTLWDAVLNYPPDPRAE